MPSEEKRKYNRKDRTKHLLNYEDLILEGQKWEG